MQKCSGITIAKGAHGKEQQACHLAATYTLVIRGIAILRAPVCDIHFEKARRALEGDTREWSATPIKGKEEPCPTPST
jgi:hypothetical protein